MQSLLAIFFLTLIVFMAISAMGNPVDILISPHANQADRARAIADLGLDKPIWVQYLHFLSGAVTGDFGKSFIYHESATKLIFSRLPATLELALVAVVLSILVGIPLGVVAGLYPQSWPSQTIMAGSILSFSLPTFLIGLFLISVFSVELRWLPSTGRGGTVTVLGVEWSFLTADGLKHMALPALNLAIHNIALVIRLTRAGVVEAMQSEYVRFARSWIATAGLFTFAALTLMALFAPYNPYDLAHERQAGAGRRFALGTDDQGRDILSAIIYGLRISLAIGVGTPLAAAAIGSALGLAAAFFGKRLDAIIMRAVDLQLSFPSVLVALILLAFLGKGVWNVVLALIIVEWAYYARTARGAAVSELRKEYLAAASGCRSRSRRWGC